MRMYYVCNTCCVRIAGCAIAGCKGVSYCILCKNKTCFRFQYPKCFMSIAGSEQPCPECRRKEDEENAKKTCWG